MMCLNVSVCLLSDISRHEKHIKNTYTRRRKRERERELYESKNDPDRLKVSLR